MTTVLSPKGRLLKIESAVPVCERLVRFNGKRRLLMEKAEKPETATAVAMRIEQVQNQPFINTSQELLVGNLPAGKVEEILKSLLSKGYYDFTDFKYQSAKNASQLVFDRGESQPYATEDIGAFPVCRFCTDNFTNGFSMPLNAVDLDGCYGGLYPGGDIHAPEAGDVNIWDEDGLDEEEGLDDDEN